MAIAWKNYPYKTDLREFTVENEFGGYFPVRLYGTMKVGYSEDFKKVACEVVFDDDSYIRNNANTSLERGGFWNALCIGWNTSNLIKTNPSGVDYDIRTLSNANQDLSEYATADMQTYLSRTGRWANAVIGAKQADNHVGSDVVQLASGLYSNPAGKTISHEWILTGNDKFIDNNGKIVPIYPFYVSNRWLYEGTKVICGYLDIAGFPPAMEDFDWTYFPYATLEHTDEDDKWMSCNRSGGHGYYRYDGTKWIGRKNDIFTTNDTAFRYNGTDFSTVLPITGTE